MNNLKKLGLTGFLFFLVSCFSAENHNMIFTLSLLAFLGITIAFWVECIKSLIHYLQNKVSSQPTLIPENNQTKTIISKSCKSCGSVFPKELDVCPTCGSSLYRKNFGEIKQIKTGIKKRPKITLERFTIDAKNNKLDSFDYKRIDRAKFDDFQFDSLDETNKTAIVNGTKGSYKVTLETCTCPDYIERHSPCKHILRLACYFGEYDACTKDDLLLLQKINQINEGKHGEKLKDIFYRNKDRKNYFVKRDSSVDFLEQIGLLTLKEIPKENLVDITYNANELKGMLFDKITKKTISKKELIELFLNNDKLLKKLPKNQVHAEINLGQSNEEYFIQALNYRLYQKIYKD